MRKTPDQKIMDLEAYIKLLGMQKTLLVKQALLTDSNAVIFDMTII